MAFRPCNKLLRKAAASGGDRCADCHFQAGNFGAVGRFGEAALAGYGLGARLEFLMIPVIFGIGAAMTAMVGANIGAVQTERALRVAWTGAGAAAVIVGSIGLLLAVFPDLWLGLFLDGIFIAIGGAMFFYGALNALAIRWTGWGKKHPVTQASSNRSVGTPLCPTSCCRG